jgi:hypothetical protein
MVQRTIDTLVAAGNLDELEGRIRGLCAHLVRLKRLDLIPDESAGAVRCRLEPESPAPREALAGLFEGRFIGTGMYFDIPSPLAMRKDAARL